MSAHPAPRWSTENNSPPVRRLSLPQVGKTKTSQRGVLGLSWLSHTFHEPNTFLASVLDSSEHCKHGGASLYNTRTLSVKCEGPGHEHPLRMFMSTHTTLRLQVATQLHCTQSLLLGENYANVTLHSASSKCQEPLQESAQQASVSGSTFPPPLHAPGQYIWQLMLSATQATSA